MNFRKVILLSIIFNLPIVAQEISSLIPTYGKFVNFGESWSVFGSSSPIVLCEEFDKIHCLGSKVIVSNIYRLPQHEKLTFYLKFAKFFLWEDDQFFFFVDDQLALTIKYQDQIYEKEYPQFFEFNFEINHTGPTAIFVLTSTLNYACDNAKWGISHIGFTVSQTVCSVSDCMLVYTGWNALNANLFKQDGWQVVNGQATVTTCGNIPIFGGFQQTGAGTVISKVLYVPPHYKLKLKVLWVKIDSWDNEAAQIIADGKLVWERRFQKSEGYFGKICGNSDFDSKSMFVRVQVDFEHTGDQVKIQFTTTLNGDSNNKSFGLRDLQIFHTPCSLNCALCTGPNESQCNKCKTNWYLSQGKCIVLPNLVILDQSFLNQEIQSYNGWLFYTKNNTQYLISHCCAYQQCDQNKLFSVIGGYQKLGYGSIATKTFNIPPHRRLRIQSLVYNMGAWGGEFMVIIMDKIVIWAAQWGLWTDSYLHCDLDSAQVVVVDEIFNHQGLKGEVILTSTLWKDGYQYWGFRNFILSYEPMLSCAMIYSECFFKGEKTEICSTQSNFQKSGFPESIKSIRIPPQGRLTLFEKTDYDGKKITYTSDQTCLENSEFSTIYLSGQIEGDQLEGSWVEFDQ